ncbi:hypothetical protein [Aquabacterium sp.]|uniref:hypothetical protein n=1 Tax=Aquabacterium sp. TaxID=1872578 RepID=UPI001989B8BA|nr:hypothetical protein [Aquabacterium sp.]MBC7699217.1 class I SAM-dependent methyltransferase [Aquabacterium sp.]
MTGFSADWLRQREPFDLAARHQTLALQFREALTPRPPQSALRILDLASGSGANFRALAPVLQTDQEWLMVDHDPLLLAAQRTEIARWAAQHGWHCQDQEGALSIHVGTARWLVRGQQLDLARDLESIDLASCDGLVTTAFLDLVSAAWLDRLSALLMRTHRPLLATLTVDGRRTWSPGRPADYLVADAFLSHQGSDKGFGPSLGARATPHLAAGLAKVGYQVSTQTSDWTIGQEHREMLLTMAREAAGVAIEAEPTNAPAVSAWLAEKLADIQQGLLSLNVGHLDLLAVPAV